jgi:hypothetical protein
LGFPQGFWREKSEVNEQLNVVTDQERGCDVQLITFSEPFSLAWVVAVKVIFDFTGVVLDNGTFFHLKKK